MLRLFLIILLFFLSNAGFTQVIDKIITIVGNNIILYSDVITQKIQYLKALQDTIIDECKIIEELIYQNLLLHQAELDSIVISNTELESELNRRLKYFISQVGSEKNLELYFNKPIYEIKSDLREKLKRQMLAEKMQNKLFGHIKVTPSQIKKYYNSLHPDSLPIIDEQYEFLQIVLYPKITEKEKLEYKKKIENIRERINKGESFSTLAILYSDDIQSAFKGGEMGFVNKNELIPEFTIAISKLKEGEVSNVIETDYGYHLLQLVEKKGELVNLRHIFIAFKVTPDEILETKKKLEKIRNLIIKDSLDFKSAVKLYNEDKLFTNSDGYCIDINTNSTRVTLSTLDEDTKNMLMNLEVGQVSNIFEFTDLQGKKGFKIIKLINKYPKRIANLKSDYKLIQDLTLSYYKNKEIKRWINQKLKDTYFIISEDFKNCNFELIKL